jgi:hypothetical protein
MFSGVMGRERVSDLLPYDYMQEDFVKEDFQENTLIHLDSINQFLVNPYKTHYSIPRLLIYTHFNKSDYQAGDNVWFTNYILDINQKILTNSAQWLFVELIDSHGKITDKKMLPVLDGISSASLKIPESAETGRLTFRAYITQMNHMATEEYTVPIRVSGVNTEAEIIPDSGLNIQFYPESGTMLSGIWNKIGIKVTGTDGAGIPLNVDILDSRNKIKSRISLNNYGMGEFTLLPKPDSVYQAKIYLPDGKVQLCKLPKSVNTGIVIGVNENLKKRVAIVINSNKQTVGDEQTFYVVIHNSGIIYKIAPIKLTGSNPFISFIVSDSEISHGVNCITVFNNNFEPMAEKQFFKLTENLLGKIDVSYNLKGDSVVLEISTADSTNTNIPERLSLSVLPGENISDRFESSLYHEFLLLPAINGRMESSEFFLRSNSAFYRHFLNLLLLTQSKKYDWAQIKQSEYITGLDELNTYIKSEQLPTMGASDQIDYFTAANFNVADPFQKNNIIYWKPDIVTTFSDKAKVTFKVPVETKSLKLRMEGFSDQGVFFLDHRTILLPSR